MFGWWFNLFNMYNYKSHIVFQGHVLIWTETVTPVCSVIANMLWIYIMQETLQCVCVCAHMSRAKMFMMLENMSRLISCSELPLRTNYSQGNTTTLLTQTNHIKPGYANGAMWHTRIPSLNAYCVILTPGHVVLRVQLAFNPTILSGCYMPLSLSLSPWAFHKHWHIWGCCGCSNPAAGSLLSHTAVLT